MPIQTLPGGSGRPTERAQLAARLGAHPFLGGMNPAHVAVFAEYATATKFGAGQLIFKEGDPANRLYLVLDGCGGLEANFDHGLAQVIDHIGAGEVLGWS